MGGFVPIQTFFLALHSTKIHLVRLYQPYVARISAHACVWPAIMTPILPFRAAPTPFVSWDRSYRNHQTETSEYGRAPPALLSINRPPPYYHHFNSWPPPDLTGAPPAFIPTISPIQTNTSTAGPPGIKRGPRQHLSLLSAYTGQHLIS